VSDGLPIPHVSSRGAAAGIALFGLGFVVAKARLIVRPTRPVSPSEVSTVAREYVIVLSGAALIVVVTTLPVVECSQRGRRKCTTSMAV